MLNTQTQKFIYCKLKQKGRIVELVHYVRFQIGSSMILSFSDL